MRVRPFHAWRPAAGREARVASPPYDVVDTSAARRLAAGNPLSFLHVSRAEMDLPDETDPHAPDVYRAAAAAWDRFRREGWLVRDAEAGLYAYRLSTGDHVQTGVVACGSLQDLEAGVIRRHEHTRPVPETDRTRHIMALNAQAEPVMLAFRDTAEVRALVEEAERTAPLFDVEAPDGVRHTGWRMPSTDQVVDAFARVPAAYIADGHHRVAGAARAARERHAAGGVEPASDDHDGLLAVLFPASGLRIWSYPRCVRDLAGLSVEAFLDRVRRAFDVQALAEPGAIPSGRIDLHLPGGAWRLTPREPPTPGDPVAALEVSLLQDRLLEPILGIADPRHDERLQFVGGASAGKEWARRLAQGEAAAVLIPAPSPVEAMMAIADRGRTMPPKSTWFDPKLASGLFVHALDERSG